MQLNLKFNRPTDELVICISSSLSLNLFIANFASFETNKILIQTQNIQLEALSLESQIEHKFQAKEHHSFTNEKQIGALIKRRRHIPPPQAHLFKYCTCSRLITAY